MRFLPRLLLVVGLCLSTAASAFWQSRDSNYNVSILYQGPGDIVSGASAWYGLRAYSAATAGNKAANICDVSTGAVCTDVNTLADGSFDVATASGLTQCSVSCNVKTFYDQTGNGFDVTQATSSKRPVLTFNCIGSLPCAVFTAASSQLLSSAGSLTISAQPFFSSFVANRTSTTASNQRVLSVNGTPVSTFGFSVTTNLSAYACNSGQTFAASDAATHSIQQLCNGATGKIYVDTNASGNLNAGTSVSTGVIRIAVDGNGTSNFFNGNFFEAGIWLTTVTAGNATSFSSQAHTYWGF